MPGGGAAAGGHGGGGGHSPGYDPVASARQLAQGKRAAWIWALAFTGLIAVFVVAHLTRTLFLLTSSRRRSKAGTLSKALAAPFRFFRRIFLRKIPKFTSGGHFLLILTYVGINVALSVFDAEWKFPFTLFAKRTGWLAVTNAVLAFLLAMKNSPLAFLTGYSHERLNVLHRWVGRTIFVFSCLHVYMYTATYVIRNNLTKVTELQSIYGWIAFGAFNVIYATSLQFIRRRFYEWFYMIHVAGFVVAVVFLGLHKPHKFAPVMYAVGFFYIVDRLIRTLRMLYNSRGQTATLIPLSGLATKVVLSRPVWSQPGSHAFLSIPKLRGFQSHPFTISSSSGVEFVIKAQKGFTLDLHKHALKHPGAQLKAYIDGPYGAVPDFGRFNRVVLIAGGSGGAFTFPVATDIARNIGRFNVVKVEFVWVIRDERHLTWYESEIVELQRSPLINLQIYVTSKTDNIVTSEPVEAEAAAEQHVRDSLYVDDSGNVSASDLENGVPSSPSSSSVDDDEKPTTQTFDHPALAHLKEAGLKEVDLHPHSEAPSRHLRPPPASRRHTRSNRNSALLEAQIDMPASPRVTTLTLAGRPDIAAIVKGAVAESEERDLVAVAACGPVELMRITRNAVADSIDMKGASVTLHCEQFGWG